MLRKSLLVLLNFEPDKYNYDSQSQFNQFLPQLYNVTKNDFHDKFEEFYSIIKSTVENHAPLKKITFKKTNLR